MGRNLFDGGAGIDAPTFRIDKTFWGYVVRGAGGPPMMLQVAQGAVLTCGAAFAAAALVLVAPPAGMGEGLGATRAGLAVVLASMSLLLLWFATRGALVELHLDLARGELRELVRHRIGRATLVGRHGLDGGASLSVDRSGPPEAPCALILRLRGEEGGLCIAQGPQEAILELRRRLDPELRLCAPPGLRPGRLAA